MAKRNRRRKPHLSLIFSKHYLLLLTLGVMASCQTSVTPQPANQEYKFVGNTQGTTYAVISIESIELSTADIDSALHEFDLALSTYIENSTISKLNAMDSGAFHYTDQFGYFNQCIQQSQKVFNMTNGAFDPTVYPLLDVWGFFKDVSFIPDSNTVDSILNFIGFEPGKHFSFDLKTGLDQSTVYKHTIGAKLVFNAIAQGQAVDVIANLIEAKGGKNYFVEIGGEIRVKGSKKGGKPWTIGIDKPIENSTAQNREIMQIIGLKDQAVATSGSYRKFYEKNGQKYSHTIDPSTGYPVQHQLLSVTVVTDNCAIADGLATAFMAMGTEAVIQFLESNDHLNLGVYLVFNNSKNRLDTYMTKGFKSLILAE